MKRLVLLVEGDGDVKAVPSLVGELLTQLPDDLQGQLYLDNIPMKIGGLHQITGARRRDDLARHLGNANKRSALGAVLLILDGDADRVEGQPFCAVDVARLLAQRTRTAGAGTKFSFAAVFLRQEYESLLLAADQLPGLKPGVAMPAAPEEAPRDAKGWLHDHLTGGYNPTEHQLELTRAVRDWTTVRLLRSFQRLEHSLVELATAIATNDHIISPMPPKSDPPA